MSNYMHFKKRFLKKLVLLIQRALPKRIFILFYRFTFPIYKEIIRQSYLVRSLPAVLWRGFSRIETVKSIYRIMPYSLVGIGGLEVTYQMSKEIVEKGIPGDFVELGVARGGCSALMAGVAFKDNFIQRSMWLFDSFEGLPDPTEHDFAGENSKETGDHVRPLPKGSCLGTLDEVQYLMIKKMRFPKNRLHFVKGWFQDTLPTVSKELTQIALLRIDGDWYESTKVCLEYLYNKVVKGGKIIVDDYESCYGCRKAVDDFLHKKKIVVNMKFDGRGGCYFEKK